MASHLLAPLAPAATGSEPTPSRRSVLRAGLAGLAGLALGALGRPASASAAAGGPIVMGATNDAGTSNTTLSTSSTGTALQVNQNSTGTALRGVAGNGIAGFFTSTNGSGISGVVGNATKFGVYGANDSASHGTGAAIRANGKANHGLVATTANVGSVAVQAQNTVTGIGMAAGTSIRALTGTATTADILSWNMYPGAGEFVGASGVVGISPATQADGAGVAGASSGVAGTGVYGVCDGADGGYGVWGEAIAADGFGVGVVGATYGTLSGSAGVEGDTGSPDTCGVAGYSLDDTTGGIGVLGSTPSGVGFGIYSSGDAWVDGDLTATGTIGGPGPLMLVDHPLDPADKFLSQSLVASPEMLTVQSGSIALDARGEATVTLPAWFGALNGDVRYQLTPIGKAAPDLHVKSEVENGRFAIAGGQAGQKVSWQLTAVRMDAYARAHRLVVETPKSAAQRGRFLHPAELGQPASKSLGIRPRSPQNRMARRVTHGTSRTAKNS